MISPPQRPRRNQQASDTPQAASRDRTAAEAPSVDARKTDAGNRESRQGTPTGGAPGDERLSLDYIFDILKNQRRRWVLSFLDERDGPVTMNDLAEHIAALENDTTTDALTSRQRKRVYVGLYQCHLPKMDDVDVIEFGKDRGIIELGENAALLDKYLAATDVQSRPWPRYYLAVTTAGIVGFTVLSLAGLLSVLTVSLLLAGVLVGMAGLAIVQETHGTIGRNR